MLASFKKKDRLIILLGQFAILEKKKVIYTHLVTGPAFTTLNSLIQNR